MTPEHLDTLVVPDIDPFILYEFHVAKTKVIEYLNNKKHWVSLHAFGVVYVIEFKAFDTLEDILCKVFDRTTKLYKKHDEHEGWEVK